MSYDLTDLDLLPETEPLLVADLAELGAMRCNETCLWTCSSTCLFTSF